VFIHESLDDYGDLLQRLKQVDIVTLHMDLNDTSEDMIDRTFLAHMQRHALLINTARGELVVDDHLLAALKNKWIGGYATDVIRHEFDFLETNLVLVMYREYASKYNNLVMTPHIGGSTISSWSKTEEFIIRKAFDHIEAGQ
jgi:phosphoglycerate dehydrogenase-like enzyme